MILCPFFIEFWSMILVTGATGLVGARLAFELIKEGKQVRAMKRVQSGTGAFEYWLKQEPAVKGTIEWVTGDLMDLESLENALQDVTHVFHCAALISTDPKSEMEMVAVNTNGTANLVNLCISLKSLVHFTHVSSVAALGRVPNEVHFDENSHWQAGKHNSVYSISKYGAEREVWR